MTERLAIWKVSMERTPPVDYGRYFHDIGLQLQRETMSRVGGPLRQPVVLPASLEIFPKSNNGY